MEPHGLQRTLDKARDRTLLRRLLGFMSIATMLMTIPQVWTIWIGHEAAGVSLISWGAYLASAVLWLCTESRSAIAMSTCPVSAGSPWMPP